MLGNDANTIAHNPPPCWGEGGQDSLELTGTADIPDGSESRSPTDKNAAFLSSKIDLAPARHVGSAKIGYQTIA